MQDFKDLERKASGQDKNDQALIVTHPSHCNGTSPTLSYLACPSLPPPPTRKGMWPTPHPAPTNQQDPIFPQPITRSAVYPETSPLPGL